MLRNRVNVIENKQLAFSFSPDGVAMALVSFNDQTHPKILACEFVKYSSAADRHQALQQLIERYQLKGMSCCWILQPEQYQLKLIDEIQVPDAELAQAAQWVVKDKINFAVADAVVDVFKIPGFGAGQHRKKMYVVAAEHSQLQKTLEIIYDQGLALTVIDIYELALNYLVPYLLPEKKMTIPKTIIVATMEVPYSQIIIIHQQAIYLIRHLTLDLSALRGRPDEKHSFYQAIISELDRSYQYCESELAISPPELLLLTPHFTKYTELVELLSDKIDSEVAVMDLNRLAHPDSSLTTEQQSRCLAALGGALRSGIQHAAN